MKKFSIGILFSLLLFSCGTTKTGLDKRNKYSDEEFYSIFTDATKHALLGNYKNAINLYEVCVAEFPEKAAPYYQIANIYLTVEDYDKAKRYSLNAVKIDDSNKWYLFQLAGIYQKQSNLDSVIYVYEKIVKLTDSPEYRYNLALFYSSKGDNASSLAIIRDLEEELEGSREIYLMKHKNYDAMHYTDSAQMELEKLIYYFPEDFENYGMLAEYLSEINKLDESRTVYLELLKREPHNGLANISFGDFYFKQAKKDSALYYYSLGFKADDILLEDKIGLLYNYLYDPTSINNDSLFVQTLIQVLKDKYTDDPRPYTLSAEYNIKREKYLEGHIDLRAAIDFGTENFVVYEQYLMIGNFIGKNKEVVEVYKSAITQFPEHINLFIYSGYSLYLLEMYDSVIAASEDGLKITEIELEQKIQYLNLLADCYREIDELSKSDSLYEEILVIDPNNLLIRNNYSYYLSERNMQLERAEELSRLTIKEEPRNPTYLDTYGWILFKIGNYKEALKYIEAAIKHGAYNNSEVLNHYGDVMNALGRCKEAIEAWNTAISYDESLKLELNTKSLKAIEAGCNE